MVGTAVLGHWSRFRARIVQMTRVCCGLTTRSQRATKRLGLLSGLAKIIYILLDALGL